LADLFWRDGFRRVQSDAALRAGLPARDLLAAELGVLRVLHPLEQVVLLPLKRVFGSGEVDSSLRVEERFVGVEFDSAAVDFGVKLAKAVIGRNGVVEVRRLAALKRSPEPPAFGDQVSGFFARVAVVFDFVDPFAVGRSEREQMSRDVMSSRSTALRREPARSNPAEDRRTSRRPTCPSRIDHALA
jgi:hypothetical protein